MASVWCTSRMYLRISSFLVLSMFVFSTPYFTQGRSVHPAPTVLKAYKQFLFDRVSSRNNDIQEFAEIRFLSLLRHQREITERMFHVIQINRPYPKSPIEIHLVKKSLTFSDFRVVVKDGTLMEESREDDSTVQCQFSGIVPGDPAGMAAFSTCSHEAHGFSGLIVTSEGHWMIEPYSGGAMSNFKSEVTITHVMIQLNGDVLNNRHISDALEVPPEDREKSIREEKARWNISDENSVNESLENEAEDENEAADSTDDEIKAEDSAEDESEVADSTDYESKPADSAEKENEVQDSNAVMVNGFESDPRNPGYVMETFADENSGNDKKKRRHGGNGGKGKGKKGNRTTTEKPKKSHPTRSAPTALPDAAQQQPTTPPTQATPQAAQATQAPATTTTAAPAATRAPETRETANGNDPTTTARSRRSTGAPKSPPVNEPSDRLPIGSGSSQKNEVEIAVFVDEALFKKFQKKNRCSNTDDPSKCVTEYCKTVVHGIGMNYQHPSLADVNGKPQLSFKMVHLEIQKTAPKGLTNGSGDASAYLKSFCDYAGNLNTDNALWDHALLLTGIDIKRNGLRGTSGLAWQQTMCQRYYSCSISEASHLRVVSSATHEIGHTMGMDHDGDWAGTSGSCDMNKFIMSPTLGAGKITWSSCSRKNLRDFLESGSNTPKTSGLKPVCLTVPSKLTTSVNYAVSTLPGQKYDAEAQCILYGKDFKPSSAHAKDMCNMLWCAAGLRVTTTAHPALEGTTCAAGKKCQVGKCV